MNFGCVPCFLREISVGREGIIGQRISGLLLAFTTETWREEYLVRAQSSFMIDVIDFFFPLTVLFSYTYPPGDEERSPGA